MAVSAFSTTSQGRKKLVVGGLRKGLLSSHLYSQPAGSRMLHGEDKLGPAFGLPVRASELDQECGWTLLAPGNFVPGSNTSW